MIDMPITIQAFRDKCLFCGHRIAVVNKGDTIESKLAFMLKRSDWRKHKIACEARYWSGREGAK